MHTERNREKQVALITGAAQGIGLAFAKELASLGYDLVLVDINNEQLNNSSTLIVEKYNAQVTEICIDLSLENAAESVFEFCEKNDIIVSVLISNAGMFVFNSILKLDDAKYKKIFSLHVNTPVMLCKLFGNKMAERKYGYILLVSSLSAWMPYPLLSVYASTKNFLRTFARAIHFEFKKYNVGITQICPGAVNTDLYKLSDSYRKIAIRSGIMIQPDVLAHRAIKKMYRHRITYIPGVLNKVFLPFIMIIPLRVIAFFAKKVINKNS